MVAYAIVYANSLKLWIIGNFMEHVNQIAPDGTILPVVPSHRQGEVKM